MRSAFDGALEPPLPDDQAIAPQARTVIERAFAAIGSGALADALNGDIGTAELVAFRLSGALGATEIGVARVQLDVIHDLSGARDLASDSPGLR